MPVRRTLRRGLLVATGETLTVVPSSNDLDPQFSLDVTEDTLVVWIFDGGDPYKVLLDYTVLDEQTREVPFGHQRPTAPQAAS